MASGGLLRVGELSRRSGVSADLLRAWERRYGLLHPERSAGGLRLYSPTDLERVRLMKRHLASGLAAAEAAALALRDQGSESVVRPPAVRAELAEALEAFDEPRAQRVLDDVLTAATVETLLRDVVLPYLDDLGGRWERGEASIAQEHFASVVLRARLLALGRGWGLGVGPAAVLACLPGERHDIGLIGFGLTLRAHGWRIYYLGSDTPVETIAETGRRLDARLVVLSAVDAERVRPALGELRELAEGHAVALGGAAAAALQEDLEAIGVLTLGGDVVAEAARVTSVA